MPKAVYVKFNDVADTYLPPHEIALHSLSATDLVGIFAVKPIPASWQYTVSASSDPVARQGGRQFTTTVRRTQIPLAPAKVSTLYGLQGCTTKPGLLASWNLPKSLSQEQKWLAIYVMLSRAPSFAQILSHGLPDRTVIEAGPPQELCKNIELAIGDKLKDSELAMTAAMQFLGWQD